MINYRIVFKVLDYAFPLEFLPARKKQLELSFWENLESSNKQRKKKERKIFASRSEREGDEEEGKKNVHGKASQLFFPLPPLSAT